MTVPFEVCIMDTLQSASAEAHDAKTRVIILLDTEYIIRIDHIDSLRSFV